MEIQFTSKALADLENLTETEVEEVKEKIREITGRLSHEDLKLVENPFLAHPVWELTVDEGSTDHRVFIDVRGSSIVVLGVFDFEFSHNGDQHWKELEERL